MSLLHIRTLTQLFMTSNRTRNLHLTQKLADHLWKNLATLSYTVSFQTLHRWAFSSCRQKKYNFACQCFQTTSQVPNRHTRPFSSLRTVIMKGKKKEIEREVESRACYNWPYRMINSYIILTMTLRMLSIKIEAYHDVVGNEVRKLEKKLA